ncbi:uncharacterized protein LOC112466354 [Temnothorax curvispinosus]|uniref:Uncharacterized protein LOC112466354 n=1 Tax=Temnothorax curvispinosus TaxID=300111 RepID=A0A6J1R6B1_9HYME|nr:uncharacterized protein LOC112466354 [Temnothorax curvispinosus]
MGHRSCCVRNCKNNELKNTCKFYKFPTADYKLKQRKKWIAAVRKINSYKWQPKKSDVICSDHFIGKIKSNEEASLGYVPSVFCAERTRNIREVAAVNRHARFMKRRFITKQKLQTMSTNQDEPVKGNVIEHDMISDMDVRYEDSVLDNVEVQSESPKYLDKETEAHIFIEASEPEKSFMCNRYITNGSNCKCDAEVQTDIVTVNHQTIILNPRKFRNKKCGTTQQTFVNRAVGPDYESVQDNDTTCLSYASVKKDEQLLDLAGVTHNNFKFLLKRIHDATGSNTKISKENRLFIFLIKMKTGLTFSAISVLFNVHRTTVSRIFFSVLEELAKTTANLVFWPAKDVIQGTMPDCFYPEYKDTRVIIDCTEFRIEVPASVDNRVFTYSHYKKGFTAKLLIGITPGGFISFKSKVAGGRKSDSQITIESGLIDLLEDGDTVLADKGFPQITRVLDEKGKKVVLVMPPFLEKKGEFTKEETQNTYNIARVRIHVERIMQRLRIYQILSKIPENLFSSIDDIVHVCCVLVNLQPPIIEEKDNNK